MKRIRQRCRGRTGHSDFNSNDRRQSERIEFDRGNPVGLLRRGDWCDK